MTMMQEVRAKILADVRVTCPVYVGSKPEGNTVTEWLSLQQVAGLPLEDLSGLEGTTKVRVQVTACTRSGDPGVAQVLRDLVVSILYGFKGVFGSVTFTGITDGGSEFDYEEPKIQAFCSSRDLYIWYAR